MSVRQHAITTTAIATTLTLDDVLKATEQRDIGNPITEQKQPVATKPKRKRPVKAKGLTPEQIRIAELEKKLADETRRRQQAESQQREDEQRDRYRELAEIARRSGYGDTRQSHRGVVWDRGNKPWVSVTSDAGRDRETDLHWVSVARCRLAA